MKYGIILFDADETLLDFHKSEYEAICEAMTAYGIEPTDGRVKLYSEINLSLWKKLEKGEIEKKVLLYRRFELFLEALGISADARKMADTYMNALSTKGYVLDGAEKMLRALKGKARMYIVTNGVEFIQKGRYARCGIDKYFDGIFISDCVGFEKPALGYFEHVAENIDGFDKNKAVIVGDSLTSDIRGGINFGIDTCWYNPFGKECPEDMKPAYTADSYDGIYAFLTGDNI